MSIRVNLPTLEPRKTEQFGDISIFFFVEKINWKIHRNYRNNIYILNLQLNLKHDLLLKSKYSFLLPSFKNICRRNSLIKQLTYELRIVLKALSNSHQNIFWRFNKIHSNCYLASNYLTINMSKPLLFPISDVKYLCSFFYPIFSA